ncbi:MAG: ERAP1-like C-terminal domain-containing protein, partial [Tepidiformaceae bacterium]
GITYGKGASVLKQLVATIELDGFREGMRHYFRTHAYGNATLAQFLASLETGSGHDLQEWSRLWLETPSLNTLGSRWQADGGRVTSFSLTQTAPPAFPTLRPHRVDIGLINDQDGRIDVSVVPAEISTAEASVPAVEGRPRPALVFPNYNDLAYTKVALDDESVDFVRNNMERITDTLLRQLLWSALWDMVRDQKLKSTDYLAIVREKLPQEPQPALVESVLAAASAAMSRYVPENRKESEFRRSFQTNWNALQSAAPGDAQIIWARALINSAVVPQDIEWTARLVDGTDAVQGLTIDQDMRWTVAIKFIGHGMDGGDARVAAEAERDPSDRGQRAQLRAKTSYPSATVKADAWDHFRGDGYGSLYLTSAAMSGFNWHNQRDLLEPYVDAFFQVVPEIFQTKDREFGRDYFSALFPSYRVEDPVLERSENLLAEAGKNNPVLERLLREANDDLARAIRCRDFAAG